MTRVKVPNRIEQIHGHLKQFGKLEEFRSMLEKFDQQKEMQTLKIFAHRTGDGEKFLSIQNIAFRFHTSPGWVAHREEQIISHYFILCEQNQIAPLDIY